MPRVVLPRDLESRFLDEPGFLEIDAATVRELITALEARFPGIGQILEERMGVVLDGDYVPDAMSESLADVGEVVFIPRLTGG